MSFRCIWGSKPKLKLYLCVVLQRTPYLLRQGRPSTRGWMSCIGRWDCIRLSQHPRVQTQLEKQQCLLLCPESDIIFEKQKAWNNIISMRRTPA